MAWIRDLVLIHTEAEHTSSFWMQRCVQDICVVTKGMMTFWIDEAAPGGALGEAMAADFGKLILRKIKLIVLRLESK